MNDNSHIKLILWGTGFATMEKCEKAADALVEKGYRKQREGAWIWVEDDKEEYWICTECNGRDDNGSKFCPNCGAHMRGGSNVEISQP